MAKLRLMTLEVRGHRDVQGRFARANEAITRGRREEMRHLGRRSVYFLKDEAPVRTGFMRDNIRFRTHDRGYETEMRVTSGAHYTVYVIRGRGPVVAKRAKALRFEPGPPGSGFIFRKSVGPAKANPFQERAFARLRAEGEPGATVRRWAVRTETAFYK